MHLGGVKMSSDRVEILRGLKVYHRPGDTFEIRIPDAGKAKTISGYFTDFGAAADATLGRADEFAVYVTINSTNPRLIARANNRLKPYAKSTTSDPDITKLNWLPMDGDPPRPAGISSTDEEHALSIKKCAEIRDWLVSNGWPANAFVRVDSGNGGYLLARIELENTTENHTLVERCLKALDYLYSDEGFTVDTTSANPARILRVPGTMNAKGDEVGDMKHRMAQVLEAPDSYEVVPRVLLEALAAMLPEPEGVSRPTHNAGGAAFDPVAYCQAHNILVHHTKPWTDKSGAKCTVAVLEQCIFNSGHHLSAVIIGWPNGMRSYRCRHNSCLNKHWDDAKAILEPEGTSKKEKPREEAGSVQEEPTGPTVIDAIRLLEAVCDGATTKDNVGFSRYDREEYEDVIQKAISGDTLTPREEKKAYALVKKYKKQLKKMGMDINEIGHIARDDGEGCENALAGIIDRIPAWIEEHHFKTTSDTERIYHYEHGVYLDDGETVLKALVEAEFGDVTTNRLVSDIVGKVKRRTYTDRDQFNNRHIINVKNGLLDLDTLQLQPHTPDYLSTAQIDVLYNPEAKAPKIAKFLQEVVQSGDVALIEEIIGWLLWPDYHIHKAIMLVGPGRNGKGTLLRLITAFMGRKSISNVTLQDLVSDTFAKSDLYGKLANIGGDLPSKDLSDTSAFRNLTGGDDNRAQEKYRPAFSFRNKAKMLFSANVLPRSNDDTFAFYSRWLLLEFLNRFVLDDGTADPDLDEKLQTPEELSGLLNIALNGLKRLKANGWKFSYTKTAEDVERMYKRNANPVFAFLIDECEAGDATDYIEKSVFFDHFKDYVKKHNLRPMSTTKFGELLKDQTEIPVSNYRPWIERGDRPNCWSGVKFKTPLTESTKPTEKGGKPENKTDSTGLQSIPSILGFHSTTPKAENENVKEIKGIVDVEYKQPIDGVDCGSPLPISDHPQKARLWDSILFKFKKYARVDKERRGLAASDLVPEELELIRAADWIPETTDQGITIFWAPEKSLKALGMAEA